MRLSENILSNLKKPKFSLKPDVILSPGGPKTGYEITVEDRIITYVGPAQSPDGLALTGYAIVPGFIDAHTHAGQTFGKSLIGGEPSQIWKRIWNPMEAALTPDTAYISAKWMFLEAMRGGYTCLVNFSTNQRDLNAAVHRASGETGIRLVSSSAVDEHYTDQEGKSAVRSASEITEMVEDHLSLCDESPQIVPSICSTSFHTNSEDALIRLSQMCIDKGIKLQIHSNEHFPEIQDCVTRFGKRPIEFMADIGILGDQLLLHHATLVTDREIELLSASNTPVSYNPLASIWKGNAVAPALAFQQRGVKFGIGSDTTSADGFKNLSAAEACQRITHCMPIDDFSAGAAWTWTSAASNGSAVAAGIDGSVGSLTSGLEADFLLVDMLRPECMPSHDFEWEFVRYYNRDQIDAVVISGEPAVFGGKAVNWDDESFINQNIGTAISVASAPEIIRVHGPSSDHRPSL